MIDPINRTATGLLGHQTCSNAHSGPDGKAKLGEPAPGPTGTKQPRVASTRHVQPRNALVRAAKAVGLAGIGYLTASVVARALQHPHALLEDLLDDPVALGSALLRFEARAGNGTLEESRQRVLDQYGGYIDKDNRCFRSSASVERSGLPPEAHGKFDPQANTVQITPNHFGGAHGIAVHEYLHCFTHPGFDEMLEAVPRFATMTDEGVTQHLARRVPLPWNQFHSSDYERTPIGGGVSLTPVHLAEKLEAMVGEETLRQAYFRGSPQARAKLDDALFQLLPRRVTARAWDVLRTIYGPIYKLRPEKLAEMCIGVALVHDPQGAREALAQAVSQLPPRQRQALAQWIGKADPDDPDHPRTLLSRLEGRTLEMRQRIGPDKFDALFCRASMDPKERRKQMYELSTVWQPVLPRAVLRELPNLKWS